MKKTIRFITLMMLLTSCLSASALVLNKAEHSAQATQVQHLRNALTDVALTQTHALDEQAPADVRINLADDPGGSVEQHHSSYHGKHVTGIVFLSLAGVFGITGALIAGNSDGGAGTIMAAILCGLAFIGFVIPGAVLIGRYPHNKPRIKE